MSILFITPPLDSHPGLWSKRVIEGLADYIDTIAVFGKKGVSEEKIKIRTISLFQDESRPPHFLSHFGKGTNLNYSQKILLREIQQRRITHVLCRFGECAVNFMGVWNRTDVPLFLTFHGYDATFDLRYCHQPDKKYFNPFYKDLILKLSKKVTFIANSQFLKSLLTDAGVPVDCIKIKYPGVKIPKEPNVHKETDTIRILHLGRLIDFKSPDRTIKAFEIARTLGLKATLTIAGDGPLRVTCELLRTRSPFKDFIHIIGAVTAEEAQRLFKEADIFTQHNIVGELSRQPEAFGISVIEAMSYGIPVVITRHGGVIETVVDGETGIMIEPGDAEAQARAFLKLASNPELRQRMGDAGRKRVSEHFTFEQEVRRLKEIMGLD